MEKDNRIKIENDGFVYNDVQYECARAIKRDKKIILQQAASYKKEFDEMYDKNTLRADSVRLTFNEKNEPIFGMVLYIINYKEGRHGRYACGEYYPISSKALEPNIYQGSICW